LELNLLRSTIVHNNAIQRAAPSSPPKNAIVFVVSPAKTCVYHNNFLHRVYTNLNSSFLDPSFLEWRLGCKTCIVYTGLNNLYIANSRIGKDKNIGKKTCNDLSVVDYSILSSNRFSVIKKFDVLDYDPLFSDVHCALQFNFSVDICLLSAENRNISQSVNWDNCKKDEFVEYLTVNKNNEIKNIVNRLDDMILLQDVSINDVNEVIKKVGNIFRHASASVFGRKCKKSFCEKNKAENKPWFDMKSREKRQGFHRCIKKYSHIKNQINKTDMKNTNKHYNTQLNKGYCEYQDKTANIIREKSRTDPKGLWKILNIIDKHKSDVSNNVTLEQFGEYFKNLNELPMKKIRKLILIV
jgi:hypothetical protein